ncbi:MAG: preprotein translocase subunit SecY [Planctomycetes bacterium]|nr:preprotein translocase subunit SecY [Planctomycetota bacterium]NOG54814.1 preprotein translocase subunit SecY [Planctomycetota bacterium]
MLKAFLNVFRIPELRNKLLFTIGMLAIYRIGFWIPLPGVDQTKVLDFFQQQQTTSGALGRLIDYMSIFSGGALSQSTIFGLGVMPYISAAIIFQLMGSASKTLSDLQKEGATGRQKIQEWTRYATVGLCAFQALAWLTVLQTNDLIYPSIANNTSAMLVFKLQGVLALTSGTIFLMWLGEQIDRYGLGNGVSLIITAGILSRMPSAIIMVAKNTGLSASSSAQWGPMHILFLVAAFVFVVAGAVVITVAQRRIPIQQARHTRGRKVYGGQRAYLPLRVNHGGVMPIIFAQSLMIFPSIAFGAFNSWAQNAGQSSMLARIADFMNNSFAFGAYPYVVLEILLIYFFSYFWTTVQFNPKEMSEQLRDHGSFIPGLRPGPRTAEYLETVMERVTYVGGGFLAIIAIIPTLVANSMGIPFMVSSFLGGTGLLIVVSVGLDFVQRIEANLLMRNYAGITGGAGGTDRIKSSKR